MDDWISVDDRLPSECESWCLVYSDGAINCMMHRGGGDFYDATHSPCHNISVLHITHWMPLPAPPNDN